MKNVMDNQSFLAQMPLVFCYWQRANKALVVVLYHVIKVFS